LGVSSSDPRNYLALGRQANAETEATEFKFVKYLNGTDIGPTIDSQAIFEGGDGQAQGLVYRQHTKTDGQIVAYARPDMFTYLSAWALGSAISVGTSAGVGTSVFTPNATQRFLTIEGAWGGGNEIDRVMSALLTGFEVEGNAGDPWKITTPFIGGGTPYYRDGEPSALSPVLETGDPAMYAGGAYLIGGATEIDLLKWNYKFVRNVDDNLFTVNQFRRKVVPLSYTVSLDLQVIMQTQNYYENFIYGPSGATQVANTLATTAFHAERQLVSSQLLAIDVPYLRVTSVTPNRFNPDGETVVLDIAAMGVKSAGTGIVQHRAIHNNVTASAYI
jgi:hypothetical protein